MTIETNNVRVISGIISTDDILPAKYKHASTDPLFYMEHIFENKFPGFCKGFASNTVLISDNTFGIGSSREQAVTGLLALGVSAIVAPSFGRIFFRNSWNLALPAIELKIDSFPISNVQIIFSQNIVRINEEEKYKFAALPTLMLEIMQSGGLLSFYKQKYK